MGLTFGVRLNILGQLEGVTKKKNLDVWLPANSVVPSVQDGVRTTKDETVSSLNGTAVNYRRAKFVIPY